jgi:hypothetical protein
VLREDGRLIATSHFELSQKTGEPAHAAAKARDYVRRHWRYCESKQNPESPADLLERAQSHFLCISGMAFQDAWNIDLERLRRCCVHVMPQAGKLVPFCSYYMTGIDGRRLSDRHPRAQTPHCR